MNNSNVAHAWANQSKQSAKGSSMFFEGDTIYSYGYHFPIAKFITVDENTFVAYNYSSYSNTTNKHQAHVRASIPPNFDVIKVIDMNFGYYGHEKNLKHYINKINEHFEKAKRSNKYKDFQILETKRYITTLHDYIRLFKIELSRYAEILQDLPKYALDIEEYLQSDKYLNWQKKIEQIKIEQERQRLIEQQENIVKQADNIVKFREFKVNHVYSLPTNLLRYNADKKEIQTSGGINMAKDTFLRYYSMFKNNTLQIGEKVEHYQYGGTKDNIIFVGCHKFELTEIENLINTIPC